MPSRHPSTSQLKTEYNTRTGYMINPHLYLKLCKGCSMLALQLANLYQVVAIRIINVHMQVGKNVFREIKILMGRSFVLKAVIEGQNVIF